MGWPGPWRIGATAPRMATYASNHTLLLTPLCSGLSRPDISRHLGAVVLATLFLQPWGNAEATASLSISTAKAHARKDDPSCKDSHVPDHGAQRGHVFLLFTFQINHMIPKLDGEEDCGQSCPGVTITWQRQAWAAVTWHRN